MRSRPIWIPPGSRAQPIYSAWDTAWGLAGASGLYGTHTHPRENGEEGESNGSTGRVRPFVQRVVLGLGDLPLVGQEAETHEPEEGPEGWGAQGQAGCQ